VSSLIFVLKDGMPKKTGRICAKDFHMPFGLFESLLESIKAAGFVLQAGMPVLGGDSTEFLVVMTEEGEKWLEEYTPAP